MTAAREHRKRDAGDLTATNTRVATSGSVSVEGILPRRAITRQNYARVSALNVRKCRCPTTVQPERRLSCDNRDIYIYICIYACSVYMRGFLDERRNTIMSYQRSSSFSLL